MFKAILDLSHAVAKNAPNWEGTPTSLQTILVASHERQGYYVRQVLLDEHASTHMDAPAHMLRTGCTIDQIPAARLVAPLAVLNVTAQTASNADYQLSMGDIALWEERHGVIPESAVVIAYTGWESRWHSAQAYRNPDAQGTLHFPAYSLEAAEFLVDMRHVAGLGIDTLSVDLGSSHDYPVHRFCASRGVYQLENVANLGEVPESGALAVVAPVKLEEGSGAPVRILALLS